MLGGFYALLSTCVGYAIGTEYSLQYILRSGDLTLIKQITKMVISPKSLIDLPINLILVGVSFYLIKNRSEHREKLRLIFAIILIFSFASIFTAAALAQKNYYFVPRMFIFLFAGKAILFGFALTIFDEVVKSRFKNLSRIWIFYRIFAAIYIAFSIHEALTIFPLSKLFT
jgi:hypothetical protein